MDPVLSLGLVVARYGATKIIGALFGKEIGGLADQLLGVVAGMKLEQNLLAEIDRKLDVLIEQPYLDGQNLGMRYLGQALLANRPARLRSEDLARAESALVAAAHSARSPLQRAQSERLLCVVRIMTDDTTGAKEALGHLNIYSGAATNDACKMHAQPLALADRLIAQGQMGYGSTLDRLRRSFVGDERLDAARAKAVQHIEVQVATTTQLLNDTLAIAQLIAESPASTPSRPLPNVFRATRNQISQSVRQPVYRPGGAWPAIAMHTPSGPLSSGHLGGISCRLLTPVPREGCFRIEIEVSPLRPDEVSCWIGHRGPDQDIQPYDPGGSTVLEPGERRTLEGRLLNLRESGQPERIVAGAGGIGFIFPNIGVFQRWAPSFQRGEYRR